MLFLFWRVADGTPLIFAQNLSFYACGHVTSQAPTSFSSWIEFYSSARWVFGGGGGAVVAIPLHWVAADSIFSSSPVAS